MGDWEGQDIDNWEEFEKRLQRLNELQANVLRGHGGRSSTMLFRGQRDAGWNLETSLERECTWDITLDEYFRVVTSIQPEIERQTEKRWTTAPDYSGYKSWLQSLDQGAVIPALLSLPGYEYLAYLRHHGFPSPFLDWTRSSNIAAYFAFADANAALGGGFPYMSIGTSFRYKAFACRIPNPAGHSSAPKAIMCPRIAVTFRSKANIRIAS